MPNQRPNHIGASLAALSAFFSDFKVDPGRLATMAAILDRKRVTPTEMQGIAQAAMEECDRFPTLPWMLKRLKRVSQDGGWGDDGAACTGVLDSLLAPWERAWLSRRNSDLWRIRSALSNAREPTALLAKWALYVDHNRYVRAAPAGELVRTQFESRAQVEAEQRRVGTEARTWTEADLIGKTGERGFPNRLSAEAQANQLEQLDPREWGQVKALMDTEEAPF